MNLNDNPIVLQESSEEIIGRIKELKTVLVDQADEGIILIQEVSIGG